MASELQLRPATKLKAKIKMVLAGISGSGKSFSALLLAFGLCGRWDKIAVIDSEGRSADLYAHLPDKLGYANERFQVISLDDDCSPEKYESAIDICLINGIEVIIIDSATHEWHYILDAVDKLGGRSTDWVQPTNRHKKFLRKILEANCHIISTVRKKSDNVVTQNEKGKTIVKKVGLKDDMREGFDYEMTTWFNVEEQKLHCMKDRTELFQKDDFVIAPFKADIETGRLIKCWCESGKGVSDLQKEVDSCNNGVELGLCYDVNGIFRNDTSFLDMLKARSILCLDNYNIGQDIIEGWTGLPVYMEDPDIQRGFKRRCIELVHSFGNLTALREFWEIVCGKNEAPSPMPFMRTDKDFVNAVTAAVTPNKLVMTAWTTR